MAGIYTEGGMQNMFVENEMHELIKNNFGHVRIAVDPLVCGSLDQNSVYHYPDETPPGTIPQPSPAMATLLDDMAMYVGKDSGMAVILCFNPYWISQRHQHYMTTGRKQSGTANFTGNVDSAGNHKGAWGYAEHLTNKDRWNPINYYKGPWRKEYITVWGQNGATPSVNLVPDAHPLVRTWKGIAQMIVADGRFSNANVYFQIMDEPLVGVNGNSLLQSELDDPAFVCQINRRGWWRAVQLKTIKTINQFAPGYRVIATPTENMPHSFVETDTTLPTYNQSLFPHYTNSDFSAAEVAIASKIISAFNDYCPYRFADDPSLPSSPLWYYVNSFYPGDSQFGILAGVQRDDYTVPLASPHVENHPYHRNRVQQYMMLMNRWRQLEWPLPGQKSNPIIMTGFGAKYVVLTTGATVPDSGLTHVTQDELNGFYVFPGDADPLGIYNAWHDKMRARWVYDTRTLAEQLKFGWSHFSAVGAYRAFNGDTFANYATVSQPPSNPPVDAFVPDYNEALFGTVRP